MKLLLDKEASGITFGMLSASLAITPYAIMARPVAGIRKTSVVITLPGSPKGAVENLKSVLNLLPHACDLAYGASSRHLHQERDAAQKGGLLSETDRREDISQMHDIQDKNHDHLQKSHKCSAPKTRTTLEERKMLSNELNAPGM